MEIRIELESKKDGLDFELLNKKIKYDGTTFLSTGDEYNITEEVKIRYEGGPFKKAVDFVSTDVFMLIIGTISAVNPAIKWLYNKITGKREKIIIDHTELEMDEGKISRFVETRIRKDE